jgi:ketosteroid isomerase-like protein
MFDRVNEGDIVSNTALAVARACLQAYVNKDRTAIEALLDDDYHFTSPIDNALDRATYMKVCWPNSSAMASVDDIYETEDGDRAFIVYEVLTSTGKRFRNCEVHTVRNGKLIATEVYFGWNLPHKVPTGRHVDNDGLGHA